MHGWRERALHAEECGGCDSAGVGREPDVGGGHTRVVRALVSFEIIGRCALWMVRDGEDQMM